MKIFSSSLAARKFCKKGVCLTLGNYDGVHLGHRSILNTLIKEAKQQHLAAVLYTFDPHPVKILAPHLAPPLINTQIQKMELLASCGINAVIVEKFNRRFSNLSPEIFFQKIIRERLNGHYIIVGTDFTFGKKREGNSETLEHLCFKNDIDITIMKPQMAGDTLVSSTVVRKYLLEGDVTHSSRLLGRFFFLDGKVVHGKKRGNKLGIPTANLKTENELIPADGVYATQTEIGKKIYGSVTNIGTNPTFGNRLRSIETHLLGVDRKIYGRNLRLYFLKRLRDEKKFKDPQTLARQIKKDVQQAKRICPKNNPKF